MSVAVPANHRSHGALLDLDDVKQALGLVEQSALGIRPIRVDHIAGTEGRRCDFDRYFHPLRPGVSDRMSQVREAFPDGDFPPIEVFQIDGAYFVRDGHHRVALARRLGVEFIDADVTQIHGPYRLEHDVDPAQIELTGRERRFLKESGLAAARPTARISLSSPTSYAELLEAVKAHGYDLIQQEELQLPPDHVAAHWYDCVFRPTLRTADESGLNDLLSSCPDGDMFLCLHRSHRDAFGTECVAAERAIQQAVEASRQQPRLLRRLFPPRRRSPTRLLERRP